MVFFYYNTTEEDILTWHDHNNKTNLTTIHWGKLYGSQGKEYIRVSQLLKNDFLVELVYVQFYDYFV